MTARCSPVFLADILLFVFTGWQPPLSGLFLKGKQDRDVFYRNNTVCVQVNYRCGSPGHSGCGEIAAVLKTSGSEAAGLPAA